MSDFAWEPTESYIENANVTRLMRKHGIDDFHELVKRSQEDIEWFWPAAIDDVGWILVGAVTVTVVGIGVIEEVAGGCREGQSRRRGQDPQSAPPSFSTGGWSSTPRGHLPPRLLLARNWLLAGIRLAAPPSHV